jgi:AGZA family xanthine/uracil permease-like MFS transporter
MWVKGDWNGFFGLFSNVLLNLIVLSTLMKFVIEVPDAILFGRIVPAVGISLVVGNIYYALMARRLAIKEGRTDVAALPYGPSVPHYFLVVFVIMLPVKIAIGPEAAWQVGVAWAFIEGIIEILGAFAAPAIRKFTPRGAMLGTLAGISISFISMAPAMWMLEVPWLAIGALGVILLAWFAMVPMPFKLPGGLIIIVAGTIVAWILRALGVFTIESGDFGQVQNAFANFSFNFPKLGFGALFAGFRALSDPGIAGLFIGTAIPMGIYNFTEAMNNVESAAAAGDEYNVTEGCLVDGIGSVLGSFLGSPFPTAMYIGHPGWKALGGRIGYSLATGIAAAIVCIFGILSLLLAIIPVWAILPILVYIGAVIGSQAFQTSPPKHAPAIVLALIPNIAQWAQNLIDNSGADIGALAGTFNAPIYYEGMRILGTGAILVGLLWGALGIFAIDRKWKQGVIYSLIGAALSFLGIIHAPGLWFLNSSAVPAAAWQLAISYLVLALLFLLAMRVKPEAAQPEA